MTKPIITFPLVDTQTCRNCKMVLNTDRLWRNVLDTTEDAYGIPAVMVRCPVCKTVMEWETKCN